jgi:hypothetical protein
MTEVQTTDAQVTDDAQVTPTIEPNPNRVWFRPDYSRAIGMVRRSRQARYGAPWDAKQTEGATVKIDAVAALLASAFMDDNPFFDAEKFLAATQLPEAPVLPEGAFDASDDDDSDDDSDGPDELAALLADDSE